MTGKPTVRETAAGKVWTGAVACLNCFLEGDPWHLKFSIGGDSARPCRTEEEARRRAVAITGVHRCDRCGTPAEVKSGEVELVELCRHGNVAGFCPAGD